MGYIERRVSDRLTTQWDTPVLVVEGARAIGKTTMLRRTLVHAAGFGYVDLSDPEQRRVANADLGGWLARLPSAVVIDEAQLLPDLPIVVKRLVDAEPARQIVLTGSASIGRNTLGGADALAGRAIRLHVDPLTVSEVSNGSGSVVDLLFDAVPDLTWTSDYGEDDLRRDIRTGGLPSARAPQGIVLPRVHHERTMAYIDGVLGTSVLPDRGRDVLIGRAILQAVLCRPGSILNASGIGQTVDLDRRTVDRYIGMFQQLFLLHSLPNLALAASKQSHSRPKLHPVDTTFSVALCERAGTSLAADRELLGALLESHVVNQVVPAQQWSATRTDAFYWRSTTTKTPEVDLVLVDSAGRIVGLEVKLAATVGSGDARGLRALRDARSLHRGYIVYLGQRVQRIDEDIWALPLDTLHGRGGWIMSEDDHIDDPLPDIEIGAESDVDASVFVSYVHADDDHARGRIIRFMRDAEATYNALYGYRVRLFIDRDDIGWGEPWRERLDSEVRETTFMVSFVTPRYLQSDACRSEVLQFASAAAAAGDHRLLLPLLWIDAADSGVVSVDDPVRTAVLDENQYLDVRVVRRAEPGSAAWDDEVEKVVHQLRRVIVDRATTADQERTASAGSADDRDVLTLVAGLDERQSAISKSVQRFRHAFESLSTRMSSFTVPTAATPAVLMHSFQELGRALAPAVSSLETATSELATAWSDLDGDVQALLRRADEVPELRDSLRESLASVAELQAVQGADGMLQMLEVFGAVSADLRPTSRAISNALRLYDGIRQAAGSWLERS